ncbi:MAG: hypothetical protein AB7I79_03365 [Rhizobiaceae bacterium]
MRILHGPVNVGNQPWSLSRAERALGHRSDLVVNYGTWLGYPADRTLTPLSDKSPASALKRVRFAMTAPLRYDVLHYYFGRGFMLWDDWGRVLGASPFTDWWTLADVRLAKALGRRRFLTLQGCDVRIAADSNATNRWTPCSEGRCSAYGACISGYDRIRLAMIEKLMPLMDHVFFLNPELGRWVPNGTFLPYANVDIRQIKPSLPPLGKRIRVVHAPSDPNIKGTGLILAALERLSTRFDFELILVQGKSHAEAMEIYRGADVAIDQILAGWYGGFAVELMAMGKPVAAYIRDEDLQFVSPQMVADIPILRLRPDHLEDDLAAILSSPAKLAEAGVRSRAYVERWHDPEAIAAALTKVYIDPNVPLSI